jgi:hypothetical protein
LPLFRILLSPSENEDQTTTLVHSASHFRLDA